MCGVWWLWLTLNPICDWQIAGNVRNQIVRVPACFMTVALLATAPGQASPPPQRRHAVFKQRLCVTFVGLAPLDLAFAPSCALRDAVNHAHACCGNTA